MRRWKATSGNDHNEATHLEAVDGMVFGGKMGQAGLSGQQHLRVAAPVLSAASGRVRSSQDGRTTSKSKPYPPNAHQQELHGLDVVARDSHGKGRPPKLVLSCGCTCVRRRSIMLIVVGARVDPPFRTSQAGQC